MTLPKTQEGPKSRVRTREFEKRVGSRASRKWTPKTALKSHCLNCGRRFYLNPARPKNRFCSPNCRKRAWEKKQIIGLLISVLKKTLSKLEEA